MNTFFTLPAEKQDRILNAAIEVFSKSSYRKASVSDIAKKAGISKALIFYYFQNKKALYMFLYDYCSEAVLEKIKKSKPIKDETDFFEIIAFTQNAKFSLAKRYPKIFDFLKTAYGETDPEIREKIQAARKKNTSQDLTEIFSKADFSKFKDGVKPEMILSVLTWVAEGFVASRAQTDDTDALRRDFDEYLELLKNSFYKEKYL